MASLSTSLSTPWKVRGGSGYCQTLFGAGKSLQRAANTSFGDSCAVENIKICHSWQLYQNQQCLRKKSEVVIIVMCLSSNTSSTSGTIVLNCCQVLYLSNYMYLYLFYVCIWRSCLPGEQGAGGHLPGQPRPRLAEGSPHAEGALCQGQHWKCHCLSVFLSESLSIYIHISTSLSLYLYFSFYLYLSISLKMSLSICLPL